MNNIKKTFGENLRREINRKHLKYAEAADLLEISLGYLNQLMKGTTSPSLEYYHRFVEKLGISADALMFGDATPVPVQDIDPSSLTSVAQIAAAMTEMNKKLAALTNKTEKESSDIAARFAARLATLDQRQIDLIDGFVDDVVLLKPSSGRSNKAL